MQEQQTIISGNLFSLLPQISIFIILIFAKTVFGATYYTKGLSNKLLKEPQHKSKVVIVLKRGEKVTLVKKDKLIESLLKELKA